MGVSLLGLIEEANASLPPSLHSAPRLELVFLPGGSIPLARCNGNSIWGTRRRRLRADHWIVGILFSAISLICAEIAEISVDRWHPPFSPPSPAAAAEFVTMFFSGKFFRASDEF
jgi:hypothetical protein